MTQDKASHRRALMRAVSILGISLGMAGSATAAEIGSQSSGGGAGKVITNQQKADYLKLEANQHKADYLKLDAERKAGGEQHPQDSHQIKLNSNQHKSSAGVTHGLNPQPEPPG